MNDVAERFIATYKNMGLTGYKISKESKVITKQKISNIESGITEASLDIISDFCNIYPNVNVEYIIRGYGSPLKDTTAEKEEILRENKNSTKKSEYMPEERIDTKSTMNVLIKTIEYYQKEVERLMENIDELTRENEMMKIELERKKASGE